MILCTECRCRLSDQAEACPDCGYPAIGAGIPASDQHPLSQQTSLKPYRLMRRAGLITIIGAGAAALADFQASAGMVGVAGCALYLIGLLGAWWNT
ncbi:hypothetical protein ACFQUU_02590 [Herbaspirillum sp. GCM10030257]|uniref:hypothetical protein n=1 Tax=Herbaspirillum sp. GCM10030257 TaxID=3273393 RepID=UPI003622D907